MHAAQINSKVNGVLGQDRSCYTPPRQMQCKPALAVDLNGSTCIIQPGFNMGQSLLGFGKQAFLLGTGI